MIEEKGAKARNNQVFIVDDAKETLRYLTEILNAEGYSVIQAESGDQAIQCIKLQLPDIILLDVMMPEMDGFEVCRKLKADLETSNIPVIFISALVDDLSKVKGFEVGAVDYITKPFRKEEVLARVRTHINYRTIQLELKIQQDRLIEEIEERKLAERKLKESEERFRTTVYSIGDGVITTDHKGQIRLMNQLAENLTGWKQHESVGKPLEEVFRIINEQSREKVEIPVRKVLREGLVVGLANHTLLIDKDGKEIPISDSGAPIQNEKGEIVGVVLVFRDQSEERAAERALRESEEKFRRIIEFSPIGKYIYQLQEDDKLIFMGANPSADRIIGIAHHTLIGKTIQQAFPKLAKTDVPEMYIRIAKGELETQSFEIEYSENQINGFYEITVFRIGNNSIAVDFEDISDRKKSDMALQESEFFFRESQHAASIGSYIYDLKTGLWTSSEVLDQIFGIYKEYVRNVAGWEDLIHPGDLNMMDKHLKEDVIGKNESFSKEYRIVRKSDGKIRWVNGLGKLNFDSDGNILSLIGTIQDITQRKEAEERLRRNERKFRALIENSSDAVSLIDSNGIEIYHSSSCQQIHGYTAEERNAKSMMELIHPEERDSQINRFSEILKNPGITILLPTRLKHKNGSWIWIEGVANNLLTDPDVQAIVINFRDVTERKQFEIKLQRSEQELKRAQQITHIGSWYLNLTTNEVNWSDELFKMYGFDPNLPVPPYTEHMKLFTPESWDLLSKSLAKTTETGIPYELELKTVREDGSNGWMWVRGETVPDATGKPVGLWGAAQDISARKHAEQLLQNSEYQYRSLFDQASDGIFISDSDGNYLDVNLYGCAMLGYSRDEILKLNIKDIIGREEEARNPIKYKEMLEEQVATAERQLVCKNGSLLPVEISGKMLDDGRFQGIVRDISDRKQAEKAILEEKNLLRTLINNLPVTVYVKDKKARKIVANSLDLATIGIMDESAVIGKTDLELFDNEIGRRGYEDDLNVIRTAQPVLNREEYFFSDKGVKHWLLTSKMPLFNEKGEPTGLVGIGRDITEQKKTELQIQKLTESIEQSPSTIVITDIYGTIEYVNPKFSEITGYTKEEAIGQNPRILKSGEIPEEVYQQLWFTISSGQVWRGELLNRKKDGELYWEWATITSIKNELGVITNYIAIKEDISLRKEMEKDLIIAKEKAEVSDRLKSAFLANMSHEIRTPLNSILGFSELLADSHFEVDQKVEFIEQIIRNGNNLLNIISDIVDISKIEAGEISIRKTKIQVKNLLDEIRTMHSLQAEEKLIELNYTCFSHESETEFNVLADKERLQQIFNNLISNALKFTKEGSIHIGCKQVGNMIEFHVKDTGIGISPAFQDIIFERFRQVETSLTRKFGGNGLGLAISKNLIELMGGEIWVESESGKGSTFYFTLPRVN